MPYQIRAYYSTGDSSITYETSTELAPVWNNLDRAKESLKLLTAHHQAYQEVERPWGRSYEAIDYDAIMNASWYTGKKLKTHNARTHSDWHYSAMIVSDNGDPIQCHVPYHGYFEHLQKLEIEAVSPDTSDMSVTF